MKVLIAGAGIGGLTAAAALLQKGFDVELFEQAPALGEVGAGIQLSANAVHVLHALGLREGLARVAVKPQTYQFRLYDTAEVLQSVPLGQAHEHKHGAPYYHIHRADLHALLVAAVEERKPNAIHLDAKVAGYEQNTAGVVLKLSDGRSASGDVLIGADGIKSAIRAQAFGAAAASYTGDIAWRLQVPASRLPADFMPPSTEIWVGPGRHAVVYWVRGMELLNFGGFVAFDQWTEESWTAKAPWEDVSRDYEGWHPSIRTIIEAADRTSCYRWALYNRKPIFTWSQGRVTLLGDAVHPTLPYMAQGGVMAIEDAAVLARCLNETEAVEAALVRYQQARAERCARIVNESTANQTMFHLPSMAELKAAFGKRDIAAERGSWLFSYNPLTVPLP